jgi:hypothetical protein
VGELRSDRIIHTNWPHSIKPLKGVIAAGAGISTADRTRIRKAGADSLIKMSDGTIYASLGGGLSADGSSTRASRGMLANRRALNQHQEAMRQRVEARLADHPGVQSVRISLVIDDREARAVEPITCLNELLWTSP